METDQARITALELAITELRAQLELLREERRPSMGRSLKCFACDGERILHVREILEGGYSKSAPLSLGSTVSTWTGHKPGDPLEVYVCRNCNLVEWYATGFGKLEIDGKTVIELTRESLPSRDPYR